MIILKSLIFLYETVAEWEAAPAAFVLNLHGEVDTFGFDTTPLKGVCTLPFKPEKSIDQINPDDYDVLIIPGGYPEHYEGREELFDIIRKFNDQKKLIGAICAGPVALLWAGVLEGKKFTTSAAPEDRKGFDLTNFVDEYAVRDGNIITATGNGFTEFALQIGDALEVFEEGEREDLIDLFRHP